MFSQRTDHIRILLLPLLEGSALVVAFWIAYHLRGLTDGIPFIQLRIPYISPAQFWPYIIAGVTILFATFSRAKLYNITNDTPLFEEIRRTIVYTFFWFFVFIGFVYMTTGFLFSKEIPRLIILYTYIIATIFFIGIRASLYTLWSIFYKKNIFLKKRILLLDSLKNPENNDISTLRDHPSCEYLRKNITQKKQIENLIRERQIDAILLRNGSYTDPTTKEILTIAGIYGIPCMYPQIQSFHMHFSRSETFLGGVPVIELNTVAITLWKRVVKRMMDIIGSIFFLIITSPILVIIAIAIKIEDPSGPVIFRNRRIGQNGDIFTLYKFRYMYWRYCTKEEYIREGERDAGLEYEEELRQQSNTREGPLYKIHDDPRKMRFGRWIERLSLDELPQLFNVLIGNMSLIGPRPHQPREVNLYDESDKQVLTIKPGITGMAQVYGRDKNTFKEEVALDVYYIENYSITLDIVILLRTILVVCERPFE